MSDVRTCGHLGASNSVEVGARFDGVRWFLCDPCMAAMRGGDASVVGVPCMRCGEVGPVGQRFKQATLGGEEPRRYDGAFTLDPYLCVACVEREEARRAMDESAPDDPRTAHGPAWSAGTPHTDEEASVILGATEPRHALRERLASRKAAASGRVVLEPSPRVAPGEPMPEATMPRAEWRKTWRDAEVPPLCELRGRCEASACVPVLTLADGMERGDGPWARTSGRWHEARGSEGHTIEEILDCGGSRNARLWKTPGALHLPIDAEGRSYASGTRAMLRAAPMIAERGWCPAISLDLPTATTPVDPATAERTWQAMRAACPERVYPEPGA